METDKLSEALGIEPRQVPSNTKTTAVIASNAAVSTLENDMEFARQNLYDVVQKTSESIDQLMEISRESQHPRAYEVLAQLLKNQADSTQQLLNLHKTKKEIDKKTETESAPVEQNTNIQNAVFVGTTSELLKIMKSKDSNAIEYEEE